MKQRYMWTDVKCKCQRYMFEGIDGFLTGILLCPVCDLIKGETMSGPPCCIKCGVSVMEKPLHRSTPKGDPNPKWVCDDCNEVPISEERQEMIDILTEKETS